MDRKISTLLFDVDGTLLDFNAAEEQGLRSVLSQYGTELLNMLLTSYRRINRRLWDDYENGLIRKDQITDTRFGLLFDEAGIEADGRKAEEQYRYLLNRSAILVDGAVEILEYLKDRYDLYVVTNGFTETQTMRMADSGLDRYFIHSFISEEVGYQKPQKGFFDCCFSRITGINLEETIIIGDSLNSDMKGGHDAGILTCWYNPDGHEGDESLPLTLEIRKLTDLMDNL